MSVVVMNKLLHFRIKFCQNSLEDLCGTHCCCLPHLAAGQVGTRCQKVLRSPFPCGWSVSSWAVKTRAKQMMNKRSWGWSVLHGACIFHWPGPCCRAGRGLCTALPRSNCAALGQSKFTSFWVQRGAELACIPLQQGGEGRAVCRVLKQPWH